MYSAAYGMIPEGYMCANPPHLCFNALNGTNSPYQISFKVANFVQILNED